MSNNPKKWAMCDFKMAGMLSFGTWSATPRGYVVWSIRQGLKTLHVGMHNIVAMGSKGQLVDHKNHDTFDNRRRNLRIANKSKNGQNKLKYKRNGKASSKFKGVRWHRCKWYAYIVIPDNNRRQNHLGVFDSEIEAARAYNSAAKKHFGKFAYLNAV